MMQLDAAHAASAAARARARLPSRALEARFGAAGGQWTFTPAPNTSIAGFDLTWSGTATAGGESTISRSDQPDPTYERRYGQDFGTERVVESNVDLSYLLVLVACSFQNPCPATAATSPPTGSPSRR